MKKFTALALCFVMAMSMAACGSKAEPAPAPAPAETEAAQAEAPAETEAPEEEAEAPVVDDVDYSALDAVELIGGDSTGKGAAGQLFGELVAEKVDAITGGQLTIDYHPNGDLGGDADLLRQVQSGDLDIVVCQTAPAASFISDLAVFDLPMVFAKADGATIDAALNGADSAFHQGIAASYEANGFHLLGFLQNATFRLTTSNKELKSLDDFKGLKIRTMENANHMAFWTAIGAEPTPMAWAEVYFSLQTGAIDAHENAADTCYGANMHEVQKYLTCTNHILYLNQICINADAYANLDPAYQAALDQAVAEALAEISPMLKDIDTDNKAKLAEGGMTVNELDPSFIDEILALDGVQELYANIDEQVNGLATTLQAELN